MWIAGFEAKRKGIDVMLELVKRLHKADFLFVAVTDDVHAELDHGLDEHVEMHGVQTRDALK